MYSKRQNKVARSIQKELSILFQKESINFSKGTLISVTIVRINADLSVAKVYLSLFPPEKSKTLIKKIQENSRVIRFELGKRVKNQFRRVPELIFYLDDSLDYAEKIDKLINT